MNAHLPLAKRSLLDRLLVCPSCHGALKDELQQYRCTDCEKVFPVADGIPRFVGALSDKEQQVCSSFDLEHRRHLDSRHLDFSARLIDDWLQDIRLPSDFFKGKLVLDAGCGAGRWTYAMASLGATVIAVDFTPGGVAVTHGATAHMENVAVVQASIFALPLRPEQFDLVVSWGVLHHTPNTKAAFDRLVPLVKRQGQLYVMVYERHNPLKFFVTDLIRRVLRRFPPEKRYQACRRLIVHNRRIYYRLSKLMICAYCSKADEPVEGPTHQLGLFDAYSPMFNHLHSREEVEGWFQEHGFQQLCLTKPIQYTTKREIRLYGPCGGSINLRGVRA